MFEEILFDYQNFDVKFIEEVSRESIQFLYIYERINIFLESIRWDIGIILTAFAHIVINTSRLVHKEHF